MNNEAQYVDSDFDLLSFDDPETEEVLSKEEPVIGEEPDKKATKPKKAKESKKEEPKDDLGEDEDEDVDDEPIKKSKKGVKDKEDVKPKDSEDGGEAEPEIIKTKDGLELKADVTFTKKVDGKSTDVSLKDLLDNYSGKLAIHKRFAEANRIKQKSEHREKVVTEQLQAAVGAIEEFFDYAQKGHTRDALYALCRLTGKDPEEHWQMMQEMQAKQYSKIREMSEEDLKNARLQEEIEFYRRQQEAQKQQPNEDPELVEINRKVDDECQKWGITRESIQRGYNMLVDLQSKGQYNEPITPASAAEAGYDLATWGLIDAAVSEHLPDMKNNGEFYQSILEDTKEYGLSQDDWLAILDEAKSRLEQESSSSKLRKKLKKKPRKEEDHSEDDEDDDEELISFDDI